LLTLGLSLAVFLLAMLIPYSARAADRGLDAFVSEVIARNPGLKARVLERASADREASAAGLWPDPQVSVMVDNIPERMGGEMPMVRYQVSQMVMWPGKLRLMEEALARRADGKGALAQSKQLDLARDAKRAYFMLAQNAGLRALNQSSRNLLTTVANAALARYGTGVGGHHEVVRAEVERNALDVEAVDLDGERISTVAMMNALRNARTDAPMPDPELPTVSDSRAPALVGLLRLAETQRPEFAAMRAMQREEATMATLARRERLPDFMTSVWYNQMIGEPDGMGLMVGATLPLFNVTRQNRRAEAADLRAESAGSDLEAMRAMVRFEVADALRRLETANRTLDLIVRVASPRAQESFSSSLSGYATGSVDIVGVLEAWRALQSIERSRIEAVIARAMAVADLERAIGGPLPKAGP
jgi:outer membrane protein TolC